MALQACKVTPILCFSATLHVQVHTEALSDASQQSPLLRLSPP